MGVRISIEGRLLHAVGQGHYPVSEFSSAIAAAVASHEFVSPMVLLGDLLEARISPSVSEVRALADDIGRVRQHFISPLVVVSAQPVVFGLLRMLSVFVERYELDVAVHRSFETAAAQARELTQMLDLPPTLPSAPAPGP